MAAQPVDEVGVTVDIEFTRKDGTTHVVEGVTHLDMEGALFMHRGRTLLYGVAAGEWVEWCVVPGSRKRAI